MLLWVTAVLLLNTDYLTGTLLNEYDDVISFKAHASHHFDADMRCIKIKFSFHSCQKFVKISFTCVVFLLIILLKKVSQ